MLLGIEIGGTKTQLGWAESPEAPFRAVKRCEVDRGAGAAGIRDQILEAVHSLAEPARCDGIGVGFGGPVDAAAGRTRLSHQVDGWRDFPLAAWLQEELGAPARLANDCDAAALAEAVLGAGQGSRGVLYVTAGTGVGGGLVRDGALVGQDRPAIAEIGHLRPGLSCLHPDATVESLASGLGLAASVVALAAVGDPSRDAAGQLVELRKTPLDWRLAVQQAAARRDLPAVEAAWSICQGRLEHLTARQVAELAEQGNAFALAAFALAAQTLGWAAAQAITLAAPDVVVIGGGVSLAPETLFWRPLQQWVERYVFPPLRDSYRLQRPALGEEVVVRGALLLAAQASNAAA